MNDLSDDEQANEDIWVRIKLQFNIQILKEKKRREETFVLLKKGEVNAQGKKLKQEKGGVVRIRFQV